MLVMNASSILAAGEMTITFISETLLSGVVYDYIKNSATGGNFMDSVFVICCAVMVRASGPTGTFF